MEKGQSAAYQFRKSIYFLTQDGDFVKKFMAEFYQTIIRRAADCLGAGDAFNFLATESWQATDTHLCKVISGGPLHHAVHNAAYLLRLKKRLTQSQPPLYFYGLTKWDMALVRTGPDVKC